MPRRHVILFQPRFASLIESGDKPHTIRPERKRPIKVGDMLDLRAWTGKPYRSKQRKLREATCTRIQQIEIDSIQGLFWLDDGDLMSRTEREALARRDGFSSGDEMIDWFRSMHGLPFKGTLIEWLVT